jgi:hypothetical protein
VLRGGGTEGRSRGEGVASHATFGQPGDSNHSGAVRLGSAGEPVCRESRGEEGEGLRAGAAEGGGGLQ